MPASVQTASGRRINPYASPSAQRILPTLHWREVLSPEELEAARAALTAHCRDVTALAHDRHLALPRPRGLALTLGSLSATALIVATGIAGLAVVLERDRILLFMLAAVCAVLALGLGISARTRRQADLATSEDDRSSPVTCLRAYLHALSFGSGGEMVVRLAPTARRRGAEAPTTIPHRGHVHWILDDADSALAWAKTFARSDPVTPRWFVVRSVELDTQVDDLAVVRVRAEVRWWPLWSALLIGVACLPLLIFAVVPGLVAYLLLMHRQGLVATKHLLRGDDQRWYLLQAEVLPTE